MESMDEKVNSNDITDYFIKSHKEMKGFSHSRINNYQMLCKLIYTYSDKLSNILKLSREYELKRFFKEYNDQMLYFEKFFSDIQDEQLNYIINEKIINQINLNLINAKKLLSKHNNT